MKRFGVGDRFFRTAQFRLGNDLQQGRAGAVQVDAGHALEVFVQRLPGVLLEVRTRQGNVDRTAHGRDDRDRTALHDRNPYCDI